MGELYHAVAEDKDCELTWESGDDVTIMGNRQLLAQAVSNLLENAIKYTCPNGRITLTVSSENNQAIIVVGDNGIGIPEQDHDRVFEPFQRLDSARSSPGSGLGLSLVRAVADLHKAEISLHDNKPGLRVEIRFPLV